MTASTPVVRRYVCGFLIDEDRRVLLIRKRRPLWQDGLLNGVGGKIEVGETASAAIEREFLEKTGLVVRAEHWRDFAVLSGYGAGDAYKIVFFVARGALDGWRAVTDEVPVAVDALRLPPDVVPNLRWLVPLALDPEIDGPVLVRGC